MKKFNLHMPKLTIFAIISLCLIVSGCDSPKTSTPPPTRTKPVVGILIFKANDLYVNLVSEALLSALGDKAEIILLHANQEQLRQNEQLDSLIAAKVDAIAINLVETQGAAGIVDHLKKAQIPAIFFNREPDLKILKTYDKAKFIGTQAIGGGLLQGEMIAKIWERHPEIDKNKDGQVSFVMFQGNSDNPEAIARTEYSVKRARELGVPIHQIGQTYVCNWDGRVARDAMLAALIIHPDQIELVIANNDAMALGAIAALNEHGFNLLGGSKDKFIPVVGVDAIPQAIAAIEMGIMSATVKQDGDLMGKAIAAILMNMAQGRDFIAGTDYQVGENGIDVRLPYSTVNGED